MEVVKDGDEQSTNTETQDQRKARTLIILSLNAALIKQTAEEVAKKNGAFLVIGEEAIFEEFYGRFVQATATDTAQAVVDDFFNNPANIEAARKQAAEIGMRMGFNKEFRIYKMQDIMGWKHEMAKEKMDLLIKFGFASTPRTITEGKGQYFTITLSSQHRIMQFINELQAVFDHLDEEYRSMRNVVTDTELIEVDNKVSEMLKQRMDNVKKSMEAKAIKIVKSEEDKPADTKQD